VQRYGHFKQYK